MFVRFRWESSQECGDSKTCFNVLHDIDVEWLATLIGLQP